MISSVSNAYNVSFSGLTKMMRKNVMAMPYKDAERLVASYDKPNLFVGYFPDDVMAILKEKSSSHKELSEKIRIFNESLSESVKPFFDFDNNVIRKANNLNMEDLAYKSIVNNAILLKKRGVRSGYVNGHIKFTLADFEMERILNSEKVNNTMKKIGVIPENGRVNFTFAGCGTYKNCFKVDFLDENGKKVIHSKAFVVCKDPNLGEKSNKIVKSSMKNYIMNTDYDKFEYRMKSRLYNDENIPDSVKEDALKEIKTFYDEGYKNIHVYKFGTVLDDFFDINGIFPEANAAIKIRHDLGKNIRRSNMITPYIYDLKNNCGMAEFADDEIEPTTFIYDMKKHRLLWIDNKDENYSRNSQDKRKVIDYGCFFPDTKDYYK